MLFHYHFWTPYVEETERFYLEQGFRISQRLESFKEIINNLILH